MLKKRYLFLIMLVCLFAISAVSGEEINSTADIELSISQQDYIELSDDFGNDIIMNQQNDSFLSLSDDDVLMDDGWQHTSSENYDVKIEYGTVYLKNTHTGVSTPLKMDKMGRYTNDNAHMYDLPQSFTIGDQFFHIHYPGDFCSLDWYYIAETVSPNKYTIVVNGQFNNNNEITGYVGSPSNVRISVYKNGKTVNNGYIEIIDSGFEKRYYLSNYEASFNLILQSSKEYIIIVKYFEESGGAVSASTKFKVKTTPLDYFIDLEFSDEVTIYNKTIDLTARVYYGDYEKMYLKGNYLFVRFPDSSNPNGWEYPVSYHQQLIDGGFNDTWYAKFKISLDKFDYSSGLYSKNIKFYVADSTLGLPIVSQISRIEIKLKPINVTLTTDINECALYNNSTFHSAHIKIIDEYKNPVKSGAIYVRCTDKSIKKLWATVREDETTSRFTYKISDNGLFIFRVEYGEINIDLEDNVLNNTYIITYYSGDSHKYQSNSTLIINTLYYKYYDYVDVNVTKIQRLKNGFYTIEMSIINPYCDKVVNNGKISLNIFNNTYTQKIKNNKVYFKIKSPYPSIFAIIKENTIITLNNGVFSKSRDITLSFFALECKYDVTEIKVNGPEQIVAYVGENVKFKLYGPLSTLSWRTLENDLNINIGYFSYNSDSKEVQFTPEVVGSSNVTFYAYDSLHECYYCGSLIINITVLKLSTDILIDTFTGEKGSILNLPIKMDVKNNREVCGSISLEFNNKIYNTTLKNSSGFIKLQLPKTQGLYGAKIKYFSSNQDYLDEEFDISINVTKNIPSIKIDAKDIKVNESAIIVVSMNNNARGTVTTNINWEKYSSDVLGGKAKLVLPHLSYGIYPIEITYSGDNNYIHTKIYTTIGVHRYEPKVNIKANDIIFGQIANIEFDIDEDATGNVVFRINNEEKIIPIENGTAKVEFLGLSRGNYTVDIHYNGDGFYTSCYYKIPLNVWGIIPKLNLTNKFITSNDDLIINVPFDSSGNVNLIIDGENYTSTINAGKAVILNDDLPQGTHDIKIIYGGDNKFSPKEFMETVYIQSNIKIIAEDIVESYINSYKTITKLLDDKGNPIAYKKVKIRINNETYIRTTDGAGEVHDIDLDIGVYLVEIDYKGVLAYSKLTINKLNCNLNLDYRMDGYNAVVITYSLNYGIDDGALIISVNNKNYTVPFKNLGYFYLSNLNDGPYEIKAFYSGNSIYFPGISNILTFNIYNPIKLSVQDVIMNYGDSRKLEVILTNESEPMDGKNINIALNGKNYTLFTNSMGRAYLGIDLNSGVYNAIVSYDNFPIVSVKVNVTITINKFFARNTLSSIRNTINSVTLTSILNSSTATGDVVFNVNGKDYTAKVQDSKAFVKLSNLDIGVYNVKAIYKGDANHKSSTSNNINFEILDYDVIVPTQVLSKYYKGPERFVVTVKEKDMPLAGEEVKIHINGLTYIKTTDNNGQASMAINLNSGVYNVTSQFRDIKVDSKIIVKYTVLGNNVTKIFRNGTQYYATFVDTNGNLMKNTDVNFNINGVFYTRTTNDKGVAKMNINLNPGTYIITAANPLSTEQYTNVITVLPSIAENYDLTKYYRNASKYTLRIIGNNGKPVGEGITVKLNINGVFYERKTNASGYINMNINLPPGTYTVTAEYNGLRASNTINVLSVLETHNLVMKYKDGSKFEAKILDGQGRPYAGQTVTFNINGVFYTKTTEADGIARLKINLLAGEYIITSMYNGLNSANKVTISG